MSAFHFYKQLDQKDCGPACLRMIAKYYGRTFSAQTLREKARISKAGVSLLGLADAAEAIGFRALGAQISFEQLVEDVALPCIVHWRQQHFVVVYDFKKAPHSWFSGLGRKLGFGHKNRQKSALLSQGASEYVAVRIADPNLGLVSCPVEDFIQQWVTPQPGSDEETGVVLMLEPTEALYEQEQQQKSVYSFEKVATYLWTYKKLLIQLFISILVGSALQLLMPFLTQSIVDVGINTQNIPFLYLVMAGQFLLMLGRLVNDFIKGWILLYISVRVNISILSDFFIKLMRLPVAYFDTKHFGDLLQRVNDHHRIEAFLTGQTVNVVFSFISLLIFSGALAIYSLPIFFVFAAGSLLYFGWIVLFLAKRKKLDYKRFDISARDQSMMVQLLQGMQEIKLAGAERPMRWAWERIQARLYKLQMSSLALNQYQQTGAVLLNDGKNIIILIMAAQAVVKGQLTLGQMLAMQYIVGQLSSPIEQLIGFMQGFQDARISLERLNEIHGIADEESADLLLDPLSESASGGWRGENENSLKFNQVSFQYSVGEQVLNHINLFIPGGKTTAIVGMSGSGKTTLLKLLLRFHDPTNGEIRLGDSALRSVSHSHWRSQCGVVMQDGFLFSDTIARNIAVGVDHIEIDRLEHAVHVANLREFIQTLPLGYHTTIGAEGNGISQGQRQRILIARAVYKNPRFIFLDEATNALDANNEAVIVERLHDFFQGRTVVVIAHRLSTVKHADQIVVLDKGVIVEVGTHAQLVATRGSYWELVKNQLELSL
ncbi:peptidase domain-containing ABC transporter [Hymenobacter elongatus]|uniref:Peptidase domain-containing ABC transporter n=1 Tax=Hymenobacter elongatus TaxID=877208 RepID=A0A4Z0PFS2_9BACT|nr:peptidase domain-containing ABC transporter [Hymenobacter elongatus]TGE13969.1 peptidase domain-containing ABC transporter [Hymenobacter elongatus]